MHSPLLTSSGSYLTFLKKFRKECNLYALARVLPVRIQKFKEMQAKRDSEKDMTRTRGGKKHLKQGN